MKPETNNLCGNLYLTEIPIAEAFKLTFVWHKLKIRIFKSLSGSAPL
jgi:hypothetical protein